MVCHSMESTYEIATRGGNSHHHRHLSCDNSTEVLEKQDIHRTRYVFLNNVEQNDGVTANDAKSTRATVSQLCTKEQSVSCKISPSYIESIQGATGMKHETRRKLCSWIFEVSKSFKFHISTAFQSIDLLDRFLSQHVFSFDLLRLLPLICLLIASKYSEHEYLRMAEVMKISQGAYTDIIIRNTETHLLQVLKWSVSFPNSYTIAFEILRYVVGGYYYSAQVTDDDDSNNTIQKLYSVVESILVQAAHEYYMLQYKSSTISFASVLLAIQSINDTDFHISAKATLDELQQDLFNNSEELQPCITAIHRMLPREQQLKIQLVSSSPTCVDNFNNAPQHSYYSSQFESRKRKMNWSNESTKFE